MNKFIIIISIAVTSWLFSSCQSHKETDDHNHGEEAGHSEEQHDEHENSNTANLTEEQMKSIKIELGRIEKKQLTASLKANGLLKVPNQNKANVTAMMGGVIKSILVQTGNSVNKGQIIATITNNSFITMQEEYISVSAKGDLAQLEYNRQNELHAGNAGALKNVQTSESELKILKARKASLQKQLELIGVKSYSLTSENIQSTINISSPISGALSNVMVNIGSFVDANNPIAEIVDNSQLHLDLYVYEKDLNKLKIGQTIHFTLTNNPGKEYDAEVYSISNTFEQSTKAVAVHARVKGNKTGLIDGMAITALVSLENASVDAVPTTAIINHEGQDYIFIVSDAHSEEEHHEHNEAGEDAHQHDEQGHKHKEKEENGKQGKETTFEKIPIRKGTTDVGYSEITLLKEIPADVKIVTNGAFFILAKMTNKGEGHEH
jgi:RND family efflux transporter MFP subunit